MPSNDMVAATRLSSLLEQVTQNPRDGITLNNTLELLYKEPSCVAFVLPILSSPTPDVARAGAFLVSELGARCSTDSARLVVGLRSPDPYVRFHVAEALVECLDSLTRTSLSALLALVFDSDRRVSEMATRAVLLVPTEAGLEAASAVSDQVCRSRLTAALRGELGTVLDAEHSGHAELNLAVASAFRTGGVSWTDLQAMLTTGGQAVSLLNYANRSLRLRSARR